MTTEENVPEKSPTPISENTQQPSEADSTSIPQEPENVAEVQPTEQSNAVEAEETVEPANSAPVADQHQEVNATVDAPSVDAPTPSEPPAVEPPSDSPVAEKAPPELPSASESEAVNDAASEAKEDHAEKEVVVSESAARVKEKLGATTEDRPVGSVDIQTMRPETPAGGEKIEIPDADGLNEDLEAEISAAMAGDVPAPVTTVAAPVEVFGDASAEGAAPEQEEVGPGSKVSGTVQHVHADDVFLNAGLVSDVVVSLKQFPENKPPAVGDKIDVVIENIDGDGIFRARLPQGKTKARGNWDALAVGQVVDCTVAGTNKGGLQVTISNLRGFLPASQVDVGFVSDMEAYVGQKLTVQITEVNPKKRNLVVSRKVLLQAERESAQAGFWESLEPGQDLPGTVKTIKNYGAFVNLGPIDGFLHVGEISWSRINHPNEVLKEGQEIQVRVLKIDKEKNRISLGMKQLVQNPWQGLGERYPSERIVSGRVSRIADFGAFVELEPGVEGLVHISELAWRRVGSVNEVLSVGDEKEFKVLEVDQKRRRVSLSLKAMEQKPESVKKAEVEKESRPPRKANPNLRGGMGGSKDGGGLFGNPSDFS